MFRALQVIHLAKQPQEHILRDLFGGGVVAQKMICQAEYHRLIRAQHFGERHFWRGLCCRFRRWAGHRHRF
jgi:hypothetical protein